MITASLSRNAGLFVAPMMRRIKALILRVLDEHRVMTLSTNRPDGWPQATMVGYVNDGYLLYCFVARCCSRRHRPPSRIWKRLRVNESLRATGRVLSRLTKS